MDSVKCLCLITGASRGFGQTIAELLFQEYGILKTAKPGSKVILLARNSVDLTNTQELVLKHVVDSKSITIETISLDLQEIGNVQKVVTDVIAELEKDFDHVVIFSNAATLGPVTKAIIESDDIIAIQNHFNINVVSPMFIISKFCKEFRNANRLIVNTSSLAALQPFKYSGWYTSAKACMDMFMKNLAVDCPQIRALNYAPGPMDTAMARHLRDSSGDEQIREYFKDLFDNGNIVDPLDSAKKLMKTLNDNVFVSGDHIDYFQ